MGKENQVLLATLSGLMAANMYEPISHNKVLVNVQLLIAVARS